MTTISYRFADGHVEDVEVTEEFAVNYAKFEKEEQHRRWRENKRKARDVSLEAFTAKGGDIADPVNRNPLELIIEQEDENPDLPLFTGLTEYQRRVAVKYFVEHKPQEQIAHEEKVSQQAISNLIKKIEKKVISTFF
jgi:DNA-directed RNA polymerase specialized sigma subunit